MSRYEQMLADQKYVRETRGYSLAGEYEASAGHVSVRLGLPEWVDFEPLSGWHDTRAAAWSALRKRLESWGA